MADSPSKLIIVAEEALTGLPHYFTKDDISQDDYRPLMASSCVPGVDQAFVIDGVPYFDGALADPVPLQKAFDEGCDRVVLILTKPHQTLRTPGKDLVLAKMIEKEYPLSAEKFRSRAERYNNAIEQAKNFVRQGKVMIIAPDDTAGVDTLKRNKENLDELYQKGRFDGLGIQPWLEGQAVQVLTD